MPAPKTRPPGPGGREAAASVDGKLSSRGSQGRDAKAGTWLTPGHRASPSRSGTPPFPPVSTHGGSGHGPWRSSSSRRWGGWHLLNSFVGASLREGSDGRPPRPALPKPTPRATPVHAPSRLLLRAPTLLSPQPLAQPPRPGKTKPGGGGGPRLRERSPPRSPPLLPQVGALRRETRGT